MAFTFVLPFEEVIYERVDGPAVIIDGRVFDRPRQIKIVQQSVTFGRFLFRPMTEIRNCVFTYDGLFEPCLVVEQG